MSDGSPCERWWHWRSEVGKAMFDVKFNAQNPNYGRLAIALAEFTVARYEYDVTLGSAPHE